MTIPAGAKFGRYEIRSKNGEGGMGEVYRARDLQLGRDVAVKVLPSNYSSDEQRLSRFEQEACAASALNHPNILVVHDVGSQDGSPYVVSELLEGETLRKRISGAPLAQRRAIGFALEIAGGLASAHRKGIVHRDLKPENIFITKDGRVSCTAVRSPDSRCRRCIILSEEARAQLTRNPWPLSRPQITHRKKQRDWSSSGGRLKSPSSISSS
jgi:eukaryotic-like serine/threonine-protein kinase